MDDAVLEIASKLTVATISPQQRLCPAEFEISSLVRKSGFDQQIEKHEFFAPCGGKIVRRPFGDVTEGAWSETNPSAINSQPAGAL